MHVCQILADGAPGGGPTIVQTLCTQMLARGVEVSVITQAGSYFFEHATAQGWRTFGLDFSRRANAARLPRQVAQILNQTQPDVLHAHGSRSALPIALLSTAQRPGFAYSIHGFHYRKKAPLARMLFKTVERFCIARADQVIVTAKGDEAFARTEGLLDRPDRWHLIHNGVGLPEGVAVPDAERCFDIAFVGRLVPQKNPLILPEILAAMQPDRPTMLIVGSGELESALRQKIEQLGVGGQITMEAAVPRNEALKRTAQARVFLLPSLWEGLPLSLAEAMQLFVPVVASRISGNEETIEHGVTGYLADPKDVAGFAEPIGRLLASSDLRAKIGAAGASYAAEVFSPDRQGSLHLQVYERIATLSRSSDLVRQEN